MGKSKFVTPKDIAALFDISYRAAQMRMRKIRLALGKNTGVQCGGSAGDPITWAEFNEFYNLK